VLGYQRPGEKFVVDTDASNVEFGGVLSQIQDGSVQVVAYFSKILSKAKRNYCVTCTELLAIVKSLEHFHKYLYGEKFHLRTDNYALTCLMSLRNLEAKTARWVQRLQEYNFTSEHRQGIRHTIIDALSRRPCSEERSHCRKVERTDVQSVRIVSTTTVDGWDQQALRRNSWQTITLGQRLREMEAGQRLEWKVISDRGPIYKSYWAQWTLLALRNGLLVRHWESADGKKTAQVVISHNRVKKVLMEIHGGSSGGYFGTNKTIEKVRQRYYWLHLRDDVERWCQQCDTCAAIRGPRIRSRSLMYQYNIGAPFERIAIEIA
jgi:hypothetical protein